MSSIPEATMHRLQRSGALLGVVLLLLAAPRSTQGQNPPPGSNDTAEGRQANRRVELVRM